MSSSLSITIRRTGLALAATAVAAVVTGSALAVDRPAASFLTKKQIEAISQSWAARGGVFNNRPAASFLSPAQIEVMSESWAARARHARSAVGNQGGLDWGDFGIGAAAMLGLVLLVTGLAAGAHYSRKSGIRPRPAS
jgi:hypothetical protein